MDKNEIFEIVKNYIAYLKSNQFRVHEAYIFGSYTNGRFNDDSDIDLAIILSDVPNNFLMQVQLMKISRKFDTRIEPHPFDKVEFNQSNPFAHKILATGVQIV